MELPPHAPSCFQINLYFVHLYILSTIREVVVNTISKCKRIHDEMASQWLVDNTDTIW